MTKVAYVVFTPTLDSLTILESSSGKYQTCALFAATATNNKMVCWGASDVGEIGAELSGTATNLGDGSGEMLSRIPAIFKSTFNTYSIIQIAAGDAASCGMTRSCFFYHQFQHAINCTTIKKYSLLFKYESMKYFKKKYSSCFN
jgi:hypothetical protein